VTFIARRLGLIRRTSPSPGPDREGRFKEGGMLAGLLCNVILSFVFFLNLVLDFLTIALVLHYYLLLFHCCIIAVSLWY
jgi:hypothetical protein